MKQTDWKYIIIKELSQMNEKLKNKKTKIKTKIDWHHDDTSI